MVQITYRFLSRVLFGFCFSTLWAQSALFNSQSIAELNQKLAREEFYGVSEAQYESSIWSAAAGIETRAYPWSMNWWRKVKLGWPAGIKQQPYYRGPISTYYYEGGGSKLLIIFGTSFGSIGQGTWYRKFMKLVRERHPDASVLIFPGYLSSSYIKESRPAFADAGVRFVAADCIVRIKSFIDQKAREGRVFTKIGSMGFSGGGSIVMRLLQSQKHLQKTKGWNPRLFNWGNVAFSPVLSAMAAADVVDAQASYLEENRLVNDTFSIHDWFLGKVLGSFLPWNHKIDAYYILNKTKNRDDRDYGRVQSLVAYSIIQELARFSKIQTPDYRGRWRLKDYYEDYSYPRMLQLTRGAVKMSFDKFSSFDDVRPDPSTPLRVVFAEDDPVLSVPGLLQPERRGHPKVLRAIAALRQNKGVRVDLNRYGGHLGFLLDSAYMRQVLRESFR